MRADVARLAFGHVIDAMQRAARELRDVDVEQAYALLADSLAMQRRSERFTRTLAANNNRVRDAG